MRRRQLLALSGSLLAGFAGCLSASAPEAPPATSSESSTTTDAPSDSTATPTATDEYADVSVELDALQPGMVTMTTPDSIGVRDDDGQYLLLDVATRGDDRRPPDRESFSFAFDGTDYRPESVDEPWRFWRFADVEEAFYDRDSGEGLLLFELPESADDAESSMTAESSTTAESPTTTGSATARSTASAESSDASDDFAPLLTWPGGEWRPGETVRERLLAPEPSLSVTFDVSGEIELHESPAVSVTVENDGDVPGQFVAGLNRTGPMVAYTPVERISVPVPAGESETWEYTDDSITSGDYSEDRVGDGEADMSYLLDWSDGDVRRDVRYVD